MKRVRRLSAAVAIAGAIGLALVGPASPASAEDDYFPPIEEEQYIDPAMGLACDSNIVTTYNGWSIIGSSGTASIAGGSRTTAVRSGDVATVLSYFAAQYNARVEPITSFHGYRTLAQNRDAGGSCRSDHMSGTALDINGGVHLWEAAGNGYPTNGGFTAAQVSTLRAIMAEVGNVVAWGGDYAVGNRDAMHFYIQATPAGVAQVAAAIRGPSMDSTTARRLVTHLYADLLGRSPDSAGLTGWANLLTSGTPFSSVVNAFTSSDEYRLREIRAAYQTYLGRAADSGGAQTWLGTMRSGSSIEDVQVGLITSQEFYNRAGGTNSGWIALLYTTALGRPGSPGEINDWVSRLNSGATRAAVAKGFLFSTEHLNRVVDGYYLQVLHRHADPQGLATWVGLMQRGTSDPQIIAGLMQSQEYLTRL